MNSLFLWRHLKVFLWDNWPHCVHPTLIQLLRTHRICQVTAIVLFELFLRNVLLWSNQRFFCSRCSLNYIFAETFAWVVSNWREFGCCLRIRYFLALCSCRDCLFRSISRKLLSSKIKTIRASDVSSFSKKCFLQRLLVVLCLSNGACPSMTRLFKILSSSRNGFFHASPRITWMSLKHRSVQHAVVLFQHALEWFKESCWNTPQCVVLRAVKKERWLTSSRFPCFTLCEFPGPSKLLLLIKRINP